jgi:hypothetical protein
VREAHITWGIHPATFLILIGLAASILTSSRAIVAAWKSSAESAWVVYALLLIFLGLVVLSQAFSEHPFRGLQYVLEQIIAPLAAFLTARCALYAGQNFRKQSLSLILSLAAAEAILALVQRAIQEWIPYEVFIRQQYWYKPGIEDRYGGTLDHSLVLGLLLCVAIWSLWYVPYASARLGLAALYLAGIGVTQSRTALLVGIAGFVVILAVAPLPTSQTGQSASRMAPLQRLLSIVVVAIAVVGTWSIVAESTVVQRVITDDGSTAGREVAYGVFFEHINEFLILGGGSASAKTFAAEHGSPLSFENPIMVYTADFGLVAALVYFGVQLAIAARAFSQAERRDGATFLALTAVVTIGVTQSFSSLATQSASAMLLWWVLALASVQGAREPLQAGGAPAPTSTSLKLGGRRAAHVTAPQS